MAKRLTGKTVAPPEKGEGQTQFWAKMYDIHRPSPSPYQGEVRWGYPTKNPLRFTRSASAAPPHPSP